jgi:hypothetical protein
MISFFLIFLMLLQSLQIECLETGYRVGYPHNIIASGAPALTSIWIEGLGLHQHLPPLTNVSSLTLWTASRMVWWMDFRDLVNGHLALTHLVIGNIFHNGMPTSVDLTISLPSLKSLRIDVIEQVMD